MSELCQQTHLIASDPRTEQKITLLSNPSGVIKDVQNSVTQCLFTVISARVELVDHVNLAIHLRFLQMRLSLVHPRLEIAHFG